MKNIILILFLFVFSSCALSTDNVLIPDDVPSDSIKSIRIWVINNITYTTDMKDGYKTEYWQSPGETLELRTGDCEDMCILLMFLLKERLNIESEMLVIFFGGFHAVLKIYTPEGIIIAEPTMLVNYKEDTVHPIFTYTYDCIFK